MHAQGRTATISSRHGPSLSPPLSRIRHICDTATLVSPDATAPGERMHRVRGLYATVCVSHIAISEAFVREARDNLERHSRRCLHASERSLRFSYPICHGSAYPILPCPVVVHCHKKQLFKTAMASIETKSVRCGPSRLVMTVPDTKTKKVYFAAAHTRYID